MASAEPTAGGRRRRILFVCEAMTLAHLARPLALAEALDPDAFDVHVAASVNGLTEAEPGPWRVTTIRRWPIFSQPRDRFLQATQTGGRLYDRATLRAYVADDLRLLDRVAPDVVVGDLRLSLSTSARLARIPYVAITNAYWSPALPPALIPTPEFAWGPSLLRWGCNRLARAALPVVLRWHARPLHQVRREHGLVARDTFSAAYTDADATLYADHPSLVPLPQLPAHHAYCGPIRWTPPAPLPAWWHHLPGDRPLAYVALGSSGAPSLLPQILAGVRAAGMAAMVAGRLATDPAAGIWAAPTLPGDLASARAQVVIGNGGAGTVYQALGAGVPVVGIAGNMDQLLLMGHVERAGCGLRLTPERLSAGAVRTVLTRLQGDCPERRAAAQMAVALSHLDPHQVFAHTLARVRADSGPTRPADALDTRQRHAAARDHAAGEAPVATVPHARPSESP